MSIRSRASPKISNDRRRVRSRGSETGSQRDRSVTVEEPGGDPGERDHRSGAPDWPEKSASPIRILRLVENFLRPLAIAGFTSPDAVAYAHIRARLERAVTP